jgi:mono/diheme cytochrome c family protein
MPNYPVNALSDEAVGDIFAYIRALPDNRPDTADIPALRRILESAERREYKP